MHVACVGWCGGVYVGRWGPLKSVKGRERCALNPSCSGLRILCDSTKSEARRYRHDVHSLYRAYASAMGL